MADTKYLVWVHDDDIIDNNMLMEEWRILESDRTCGSVSTNAIVIKENGEYFCDIMNVNLSENYEFNPMELIEYDVDGTGEICLPFASSMYRTEVVLCVLREIYKNKLFGPSMDDIIRFIINEKYKIILLKEKLYYIRKHAGQASGNALLVTQDLLKNVCRYMEGVLPYEKAKKYRNRVGCRYIANLSNKLDEYILKELNLNLDWVNYKKEVEDSVILSEEDMLRFKKMSVKLLYIKKYFCKKGIKNYYLYGSGS